ncbi:MAG TPA: acyltransferase [Bacteroidales bacterium]|nr:acyltransferase [Bacteroidales bacterium]
MEIFEIKEKNIRICAKHLSIGTGVEFGKNINISVKETFSIGDMSYIGPNTEMRGRNIVIGKYFYTSGGLRVGGGGRQHPGANLTVGDRCTFCNNLLNVCEPIVIGNDVGLSEDVSLITHGFWLSALDGYPAEFRGITLHDGVIVGYRTIIMFGVEIGERIVVGANSTVTRSLTKHGVYVGSPARFIKEIVPLTHEEKVKKTEHIISEYLKVAEYHELAPKIEIQYPVVSVNNKFFVNFETLEFNGEEDMVTDDFRDYVRKWGIRIFTGRNMVSNFKFD